MYETSVTNYDEPSFLLNDNLRLSYLFDISFGVHVCIWEYSQAKIGEMDRKKVILYA